MRRGRRRLGKTYVTPLLAATSGRLSDSGDSTDPDRLERTRQEPRGGGSPRLSEASSAAALAPRIAQVARLDLVRLDPHGRPGVLLVHHQVERAGLRELE